MNEFLLLFRMNLEATQTEMSPEEMQAMLKPWQDWMGSLAAQNKLAQGGNRLGSAGKRVVSNGLVTDGPYVEMKEGVSGYTIVRAEGIDEAAELAKGCPILYVGGNVEVRPIM